MGHNMALGRFGEDLAVRHLRERGLVILDRNWRCDVGEIDIVAREADVLVVCEVKTRRTTGFGSPLEAVTQAKAQRLLRLAACWLREHRLPPVEVRVDLVGVVGTGPDASIEYVRSAL